MADITQAEATGAITDLLMTVMLIPFLIYLIKSKTQSKLKKYWTRFIAYLTASTFMGFIAHYFCKGLIFTIIWVPLYILLFSTVNSFLFLALASCGKPVNRAKKYILILTSSVMLITEYIEFIMDLSAIRLYTSYAFVAAFIAFGFFIYNALKNRDKASIILLASFPPLCIAGVFQLVRNTLIHIIWDFNEDGITHIFIIFAIGVIFLSAKTAIDDKKAVSLPPEMI